METVQFWRELESEVSTLCKRPGADYLHAVHNETTPVEIANLVEAVAERMKSAIQDASPEAAAAPMLSSPTAIS